MVRHIKNLLLKPYYAFKIRRSRQQIEDETTVLTALGLDEEWVEGFDLHKATGLNEDRIYNALTRLESADMVSVEWEIEDVPEKYRRRLR